MTLPEINAAQASINKIFQSAKATGYLIPEWIKVLMHDEYNRLTELKKSVIK